MGRIKNAVSEKRSAALANRDGSHAMGGTPGLYLYVAGRARSWILRYSFAGKRREMGLGALSDVTLAEARAKALAQRKLILDGIDPITAKRDRRDELGVNRAKRVTFQQCVNGYLDAHGDKWKNPKHRAQWRSTLETYAGPVIGEMNVARVDLPLVLEILNPIWKTKTETASRLRARIENVLSWATVSKYRTGENPARWKGNLDQLLAKPSQIATVEHHAALPYKDIGAFMGTLRQQNGIAALALEFTILTAARTGETLGAPWSEFDLKAQTWTIPAVRMKAKRDHLVPLSAAAVAVLKKMAGKQLNDYVFPGVKEGKPLSDMSMTEVLRRMGHDTVTVHGFRSSFRDWASEATAYPSEMAEMALAHAIGNKVEAAYRRGDLYDKRVRMMADWERHCATVKPAGKVIQIKRRQTAQARA